ncbi:MAG TPA: dihydrolipoyl dehydrogenase [Deltaproteobacteria bacterium]|jgi:dihydrolipoamide dehydrogenase|nr:dihydrolipoyl dehydrogenase [Deltaproteobacteria bacterium]HQI00477.1 dihydrolipoyl dehydrogenase [Deltaproteobacteria bacterium]HQJ07362.1 dihydrolipoyl dehydrogenase [Deltaproteobacteria bacterium]
MEKAKSYDVFVIGAGPGGYTAAILAAKKGLTVGIAEGSRLGGTCTNTGCIPAKTYIESVNLLKKIREAAKFAIDVEKPRLDFPRLKARKDRIVTRLSKGIEFLLKKQGVDVFPCTASVPEPGSVIAGDVLLHTGNTIIATGSRPKRLAIFEKSGIWTSDEVFEATSMPASLAIVGGGVIGMEMAHVFSTMGTDVTIIEAMDRILPLEDKSVSEYMSRIYRKVHILTSSRVTGVEGPEPWRILVDSPGGGRTVEADKVLLCIGRQPLTPPRIEELGLERTASGGIRVDEFMRASIPGIYAIGDVTGEYMYAYVASKEAETAVDHIMGGERKISYRNIPSIIFTDPEVASVGSATDMTEVNGVRSGTFPVSALGRARTMEENEGYAEVVSSRSGVIEKINIVAPHATELIPWAGLAVDRDLTIDEFLGPYYPHPLLAEVVKEAAEDIMGFSIHHP